jgi:hypothetical protein
MKWHIIDIHIRQDKSFTHENRGLLKRFCFFKRYLLLFRDNHFQVKAPGKANEALPG